jgi:hypothetical protein
MKLINDTMNIKHDNELLRNFGANLKQLCLERAVPHAANSTLAIGGVSSPLDSFVVAESSVLRTNFCAEKSAHRQSAKRYRQP